MSNDYCHKGTSGKPRSGLIGSAEFYFQSALITPLDTALVGAAGFGFNSLISPGVVIPQIDATCTLVLDNYDVLSSTLQGKAASIQNTHDHSEMAWFLDNIGGGTECCGAGTGAADTGAAEYTTLLAGLSYEIPRTAHGIAGFPTVTVITDSGDQVSVCVDYVGESIFITSNILLDNHTAILR